MWLILMFLCPEPPAITGITISPSDVPVGSNVSTLVGDWIVLRCGASGYPKPFISWTVSTNNTVETLPGIEVRNDSQQLVIASASKSHGSQYSCVARNRAGEARQAFAVIVLDCVSRSRGCSGEIYCTASKWLQCMV